MTDSGFPWAALIPIVLALFALPSMLRGLLVDWPRAGFFLPAYVHAIGLILLTALWSVDWIGYGVVIGPFFWCGLLVYGMSILLYGCWGAHDAREMERCESRGIWREDIDEGARTLLIETLLPYRTLSRGELASRLWHREEKKGSFPDGRRYRLLLRVGPARRGWEDGINGEAYRMWTNEVAAGGEIMVGAAVTELDRGFLLHHPRAVCSFQMDVNGHIRADGTGSMTPLRS